MENTAEDCPRVLLDDDRVEYENGLWEWAGLGILPDGTPPNMKHPGLPFEVLKMRDDAPDAHAEYVAGGPLNWRPAIPEDRVQCALMDTHDGPAALLLPADHQEKARAAKQATARRDGHS